jgi:hypothetical protein
MWQCRLGRGLDVVSTWSRRGLAQRPMVIELARGNADASRIVVVAAVGKWMCGGRSATDVSDLPKSDSGLLEVSP